MNQDPDIATCRLPVHDHADLPQCLWRVTHGNVENNVDDGDCADEARHAPGNNAMD